MAAASRIRAGLLAVLLTAPLAGAAAAQGSRGETTILDAPTYAHFGAFRNGETSPGKLGATVWLPNGETLARNGRLPAVVIGHSVGGWKETSEGSYVPKLLEAGYAVIGLDHFGPRGITRAADVAGAFSPITAASDALLALKLAAAHPRIDPQRIGVMGLSMGGITSELTAYEFVRRKVLGNGSPLKFAAHVPFYAPCSYHFAMADGPATTGAPMLKLYAGKDETTPRAKCEQIDALVRAAEPGLVREVHWYPEAYHAWEVPWPPRFFPQHVNASKCPVLDFGGRGARFIDPDGRVRAFNGQEMQACLRASTGYSMGRSEEAVQDAPKRMLAFFARYL